MVKIWFYEKLLFFEMVIATETKIVIIKQYKRHIENKN